MGVKGLNPKTSCSKLFPVLCHHHVLKVKERILSFQLMYSALLIKIQVKCVYLALMVFKHGILNDCLP